MLSKRSPPPRPPMPTRKAESSWTKTASQAENQEQSAAKKLDFFSIRYSRDDANESDEEISIVRKEDSVVEEEENGNEVVSSSPDMSESTENTDKTKDTNSSLLSNISLPFLSRSPSKSSIGSLATEDKLKQQNNEDISSGKDAKCAERSESEVEVVGSGEANGECNAEEGILSCERSSGSPPKRKNERITDAVRSHAISLSSLLKKEVEHIHFGRGSHEGTKESVLSTAFKNTSMFLMPLGMNEENVEGEVIEEKMENIQHTDVPIYNIFIASVIVFLYLMLPTYSFVNGFVVGGFLTFFFVCALMWLLTPEMSDEERYKRDLLEHKIELEHLGIRKGPRKSTLERCSLSKPADLEGWFFKASSYTYNPSDPVDFNDREHIIPVFALLAGHTLTFNIPRKDELSKIKRSNMLESNVNVKFSSSKEYDLRHGGDIELVPDTLTLKRIWAKKYPIYLKIFEKPFPTEGEEKDEFEDNFEFPTVTEEMYLFSPTARSKEEWYYRMERLLKPRTHHGTSELENIFNPRTSFSYYMSQLIGAESEPSTPAQLTWVNAFLGRIFWDVWKSEHWSSKVRSRIQNKISRMKLPPFIRYLKVTDMRLGNALPRIQRAHNLVQDHRGVWVDLDVDYQGGIMLTIETMVNLEYYLKQLTDQGKNEGEEVVLRFSRDTSGYSDASSSESDDEDLAEYWSEASEGTNGNLMRHGSMSGSGENSSSEAEVDGDRQSVGSLSSSEPSSEQDNQGWAGKVKNPKGKKILNMLEKVAKSKWVQKAAETKVVQRAVEKFSNLPIVLGVEVVRLRGTLAANIPPPPSNRLWMGFHSGPLLSLIARPKLGERHVRLTHVTEWIEYKLKQEFKSMFVLPNMEDLTIRIMDSGLEEKFEFS